MSSPWTPDERVKMRQAASRLLDVQEALRLLSEITDIPMPALERLNSEEIDTLLHRARVTVRLLTLRKAASVPEEMTMEQAVTDGLLSEAEIAQALDVTEGAPIRDMVEHLQAEVDHLRLEGNE